MLWDKMSCFSFGDTVPTTASTDTISKVLDFKLNTGLDDHLRIFGMITGAALTAGTITVHLQECDTVGGTYTDITTATIDGNKLIDMALPREHKRFMRLKYSVGETALNRAVVVWAGLVLETEIDKALEVQNLNVTVDGVNTGLEDLSVTDSTLR